MLTSPHLRVDWRRQSDRLRGYLREEISRRRGRVRVYEATAACSGRVG